MQLFVGVPTDDRSIWEIGFANTINIKAKESNDQVEGCMMIFRVAHF